MNPDQTDKEPVQKKKRSRVRKLLLIAGVAIVLCAVLCALILFAADRRVEHYAAGRVYSDVEDVPAREYGLVPGTSRLVHGKHLNTYFSTRIRAALELYRAGKIRKIIVSGDNGRTDYNETGDMARELITQGVAPEDVLSDYAGFRTLDSVVRARNLFGASEITVITQRFHCERAIYLAARHGIDAVGFEADEVAPRSVRIRLTVREAFARVLAVLDAEVLKTKPHFEY
ncbi:MAG: YdcF family protein [Lentisphaeria bacterium]|nr:YdcF family protein [Lentisphaeria bacterium]